jgi:hypothetical protein
LANTVAGFIMRKATLLVLMQVFRSITAFAQQPFSLDGYYKSFFVVFHLPEYIKPAFIPDQPDLGAVNNRLRLKLTGRTQDWLSAHLAYDFVPRVQDPLLFDNQLLPAAIDPLQYRAFDFEPRLYPAEKENVGSFAIFHNLDRAVLDFKTAAADIAVGRQAIAWGSARVINPTDVIAPYVFQELDREERIGVDAVRVRVPVNALSEMDAGYVFGRDFDFDQSAFFVRSKLYVARADVSLLLLGFRENLLAGIDVARSLGGAGFWLEGAYVFADLFSDYAGGEANDYLRSSIGLDYSFSSKTYGFIEYHFSGAGASRPQDYLNRLTTTAFTEGAVYLVGRHYLAPGLVYQLTPLLISTTQALFNVGDRSVYLSTQVEYNLAQNIYLAGGMYLGLGKRPEILLAGAASAGMRWHSEFGSYPDFFFTAFRVYF